MRYFNYLDNRNELLEGYYICKKIIKDVLEFDDSLLTSEEKNILKTIKNEVNSIKEEFNINIYEYNRMINSELLSQTNVEYAFKHKKYPNNASKTGEKINNLYNKIFVIEDKMQIIVANLWKRIITPFQEIKNGENFIVIGHSGYGYINFPNSSNYINNEYNNLTTYSCSIFNNKSMNEYNSKLVAIFDINKNNFICANYLDTATRYTIKENNIKTLKITDKGYTINAGYSNISEENKAVTKSEHPLTTLANLKNEYINEVILDKQKSFPKGLLLFSNGNDFLFYEYIEAIKMKYEYNLDLKVINKSLYFDIPLDIDKFNSNLSNIKEYILNLNIDEEDLISLIDGYINDVIIPLKLNKELETKQIEFLNEIKENIKQFKY